MLDIFVPEVMLERPGVLTIVGELEAAGVTKHVRMNLERHPGGRAEPAHHSPKSDGAHRCPALAHEQVAPRFLLSLQSPECPKLSAGQWMRRSHAALEAGNMEAAMSQVDLIPTE
jgi:hypothetical protein